jgi:hypothetical protein
MNIIEDLDLKVDSIVFGSGLGSASPCVTLMLHSDSGLKYG